MKKVSYSFVVLFIFSQYLISQQHAAVSFAEIRKQYEKMNIDDKRAVPYVRQYIQKAKLENNIPKLLQGYRDGRQFDLEHKINYADSALQVSRKLGKKDELSRDHLSKGIIYYFYDKDYKEALNQYLKAYEYSKGLRDDYHYHKVLYHLGIVKQHLGYYREALEYFQDCAEFYRSGLLLTMHENEQFNYKKAYYNSLHQLVVSNRYLKNFKVSDSISRLGYRLTENQEDFTLENSYFLKSIGISQFLNTNYTGAKASLEKALPVIRNRNDFAWTSVIYYYMGKIAEVQHDEASAVMYYSKVDSIFTRHGFIFPEVFKSYHYLIDRYKKSNVGKQLYYTNQLLKADSLLTKDYPYLSLKLHKEYDRKNLMDQKDDLERVSTRKMWIAKSLLLMGTVILSFFVIRYFKDRHIKKQYNLLQKKMADGTYTVRDVGMGNDEEQVLRKTSLTSEMTAEIREKLEKFEQELQFKKKGLTQKSIARKLGTNSHYLSVYVNENKGMNFNRYMAELRINYITQLLHTNQKYLNYTIEALAEECGIAARQNFSKLFFEINGIRPADYIRKRKQELGIK